MFTTNPVVYFQSLPFRIKMVLLVLAGVNMLVFQLSADRTIHLWDESPKAPPAGRVAAILSLLLWTGVIVSGRWIGFTTSHAKVETPAAETKVDFDDFLSSGAAAPPPAQPAPPAAAN